MATYAEYFHDSHENIGVLASFFLSSLLRSYKCIVFVGSESSKKKRWIVG